MELHHCVVCKQGTYTPCFFDGINGCVCVSCANNKEMMERHLNIMKSDKRRK